MTLDRLLFDAGRMAATAIAAAIGGGVANAAGIPLGFLIGAMFATAALSLFNLPVAVVPNSRQAAQGLIGIGAGLRLTPDVAERLAGLFPVMLASAFALILAACLISLAINRLTRLDPDTAFFMSLPGGIAEMAVLSERYGGVPGLVSIGQFLRILFVTLTIPQIVFAFGRDGAVQPEVPAPHAEVLWLPLIVLCIAAIVLARLLSGKRVPNAWLLSGIIAGAGAALFEWHTAVPLEGLELAQIFIGISLGARCTRAVFRDGYRFLPANLAGTATLVAFSTALAFIIGRAFDIDTISLVLALAPGGIAEMSLVSGQIGADTVLVVAFHLVRVVMVLSLAVLLRRIFLPKERDG
ncbi:AbrB family transcriptional regulator [Martelella lutilitoris]|uniref:AbrB family transcriptional regulator n=2 Tax=Martelella lutilitoris TaxID=2583532 RepID=A0A5C4JVE9_9HYPH|nr:AbrB family transcriptional regulator [Martelella lutilitoris]